MSREAARKAFTDAVLNLQATFTPGIEVVLPNRAPKDPNSRAPYLNMMLRYMDGYQASLGRTQKHHRVIGSLVLEFCVPVGEGEKLVNDAIQHFYPSLHMTDDLPDVRTQAARFIPAFERLGWMVHPVIIPFWFDDFS